jgi:ribosomal subunit interface protein
MDIIFKGRQTDVPERFRQHATAKLSRLERLDQKAMRVDVEVSVERNPRQASHKERVELTISSRGPAIRAEAAAEDRFAALDLALAKLGSRLRRALDRRKGRHSGHAAPPRGAGPQEPAAQVPEQPDARVASPNGAAADGVVPIEMQGSGPLVVRQKFHRSDPITIDQALLEMELVGHDFYLFHDIEENLPSVVYRRRGYQYGVIRLVDSTTAARIPRLTSARRAG